MLSFQWGKCQVGSANFLEDISLPWQKATETGFGPYTENWEAGTHPSEPRWSLLSSTEHRVRVYIHTCIMKQFSPKCSGVAHYRVRMCLLDRHIPSVFQKKHWRYWRKTRILCLLTKEQEAPSYPLLNPAVYPIKTKMNLDHKRSDKLASSNNSIYLNYLCFGWVLYNQHFSLPSRVEGRVGKCSLWDYFF